MPQLFTPGNIPPYFPLSCCRCLPIDHEARGRVLLLSRMRIKQRGRVQRTEHVQSIRAASIPDDVATTILIFYH